MTTERPRENLYLSDEISEQLEAEAKRHRVSKSKLCRIIFTDYFDLRADPIYKRAIAYADEHNVTVSEVILSALKKVLKEVTE